MRSLRVAALLINKPGHRHQAEGLAAVIARMAPIETDRVEIRPALWAHAKLRYAVMRWWRGSPATLLRRFYGIDPERMERPDIVVSSGRPAIAAGVLLGRHFGAPFVYAGLANRVPIARDITLMLVSTPSFAGGNAVLGPVPSKVDPDALPPARRLERLADLRSARVSLLVGGDAHSHRFHEHEWRRIADTVRQTARDHGMRWRIITSRRTGETATGILADLDAEGVVEQFIDHSVGGAAPMSAMFDVDAIVVTEDSVSMMSEAVQAMRPVVALRPRRVKATLVDSIVHELENTGALASLPIDGLDGSRLAEAIVRLTPDRRDWRDRTADVLRPLISSLMIERDIAAPGAEPSLPVEREAPAARARGP